MLASPDQRTFEFVKILTCILHFYPKYLVKWGIYNLTKIVFYIIDKIAGKISTNFSQSETQQVFTSTRASCSVTAGKVRFVELKSLC